MSDNLIKIIKDAISECEQEMEHYAETGDGYEYEYEKGKKTAFEFVLAEMKKEKA